MNLIAFNAKIIIPEIKKNEQLHFDAYPAKYPLLKLNKEILGTNELPYDNFFEDRFIEEILYEIRSF